MNDRPYSDHEELIQLQQLNGAEMGTTLYSRYSATNIIDNISSEMRKTICTEIQRNDSKIAILVDEATTISKLSVLCVYICASISGSNPQLIFLELLELQDQAAATIEGVLLNCLHNNGFSDSFLKKKLASIYM